MSDKASNYMCVGTTFEKDGTTYVVREANANLCKGVCILQYQRRRRARMQGA